VEIKARVTDLAAIRRRVEELAEQGPTVLEQEDTFLACPRGRLKLRQFADSAPAELIYYERADGTAPRESRYVVHRVADPDSLRQVLSAALGIRGVVRKRRTLYLIGPTRVHLDEVKGLGSFVELEVVLRPGQAPAEGMKIAQTLMDQLGIQPHQLVDRAYVDLHAQT
jgi:predicted adenylyl cyclase CyaB